MSAKLLTQPFPDGAAALYDDVWWQVLPASFRRSPLAWRARKALVDVFDDNWLREQSFHSHPIGLQSVFRYGRWALLRLGAALSIYGISTETRHRLRTAEHYAPCVAELDFGLFLHASGARVQHEPRLPKRGPDFFGEFPIDKLAFEVKHPRQSSALRALESLTTRLSMEMSGLANRSQVISGWGLELVISGDCLEEAVASQVTEGELWASVQHAIIDWCRQPRATTVPVGRGVSIRARRSLGNGVQVSGPAFAGDAEYEMRRLLRLHVSDAAEQLEAGGVQGFVVFSREESGLLENHMRALSQAVRDNREKTLSSVMGLIAYDTNVDKFSRVVASARIHLKSEARSLCSDLSLLGRGGRVDLRLF